MLGNFGRRAVELTVLFLALYAFAFVPLGKRTGLEHARAILGTRAAASAGRELLEAGERLRKKLFDDDPTGPVPGRGAPVVPKLPRGRAPENAVTVPAPEGSAEPAATVLPGEAPDASM